MVPFLIILLLILMNGYFSAAEVALISVKKYRLQQDADRGNKRALQVLELLKDPDEYLSSIQVGITIAGMVEGLYGGTILASFIEPRFLSWGLSSGSAHFLALFISISLITYITIVIGELLPKSIALQFPQKTAMAISFSFKIFTIIAYPFVKLLTMGTHLLVRLLRIRNPEKQRMTDADLRSLLSLAYRQGTLEKNELTLHENIFNFYDARVEQIMTPSAEVVTIDKSWPRAKVEDAMRNSVHSFFPVVELKNIVSGVLSAKDFFMFPEKSIREIAKPPCAVNRKQTATELLQKFKEKGYNFGIVVNEAGEFVGVVTMHDVGEILIGEIP